MGRRVVVLAAVLLAACAGSPNASSTPRATTSPNFAQASPATPVATTSSQPSGSASSSRTTTLTASYARAKAAPPVTASAGGTITGHLGAPCECLPPFDVYAITPDGRQFYVTQSVDFQTSYTMVGVAAGDYYVLVAGRGRNVQQPEADRRFAALYSKAVPCGLDVGCTDHSLLAVHVQAGKTIANINPTDFYAPFDSYPLVPTAGPAQPVLDTPPSTFSTAESAAIFLGRSLTAARYVSAPAECPSNVACFWFTSHATGTQAAYYLGAGGANGNTVPCNFYLTGSGTAWKTFDDRCGGSNFPAVGMTGTVQLGLGETGCVNVRSSPSLSARTVACLNQGSAVTLDQGPVYVPTGGNTPFNDYWWHIAGKGWMVHTYLRNG